MEEKETYLVKMQRVWVGQLEVVVAEKSSESRNTGERRTIRQSVRRPIRERARWDGHDIYRGIRYQKQKLRLIEHLLCVMHVSKLHLISSQYRNVLKLCDKLTHCRNDLSWESRSYALGYVMYQIPHLELHNRLHDFLVSLQDLPGIPRTFGKTK